MDTQRTEEGQVQEMSRTRLWQRLADHCKGTGGTTLEAACIMSEMMHEIDLLREKVDRLNRAVLDARRIASCLANGVQPD